MDKVLELQGVSCGYGKRTVVKDVSFDLKKGEVLCLLGPNGVGKSTLFKAILGFLKVSGGDVLVKGKSMKLMERREVAKTLAFVPQLHRPVFPFSVLDMVLMGRTAHTSALGCPGKSDVDLAKTIMEKLGIVELADKSYTEISGGQQQMTLIARALAQQADVLIMDEPTASLDYGNQVKVLEQIKSLSEQGLGVIMTTHFPDHAFLCATKVALMQRGGRFEVGGVNQVVTEQKLGDAYGIRVRIASALDYGGASVNGCIPLLG